MRDFRHMGKDFREKSKRIDRAFDRELPKAIGEMHVDGFKDSFKMQRFNDSGAPKWPEVERRKPSSSWYGFSYKGKGMKTFSPAATRRAILHGSGSAELRDSIHLRYARAATIRIANDKPYAQAHNEGGKGRIFGRKPFTQKKRQFMGHSHRLDGMGGEIITRKMNRILGR